MDRHQFANVTYLRNQSSFRLRHPYQQTALCVAMISEHSEIAKEVYEERYESLLAP
jgi:hypothetical protein